MALIAFRSIEQENILRRDFIIYALSQTPGDCMKSKLLFEFATLHFPDRVAEIKQQCNETYRKKHERIDERIHELQPFNSTNAEEVVTTSEEPAPALESAVPEGEETFENPDRTIYLFIPDCRNRRESVKFRKKTGESWKRYLRKCLPDNTPYSENILQWLNGCCRVFS
jgi:hypothetical protein